MHLYVMVSCHHVKRLDTHYRWKLLEKWCFIISSTGIKEGARRTVLVYKQVHFIYLYLFIKYSLYEENEKKLYFWQRMFTLPWSIPQQNGKNGLSMSHSQADYQSKMGYASSWNVNGDLSYKNDRSESWGCYRPALLCSALVTHHK